MAVLQLNLNSPDGFPRVFPAKLQEAVGAGGAAQGSPGSGLPGPHRHRRKWRANGWARDVILVFG